MKYKDSCPPFMSKLAQPEQFEWHITKIRTDSRWHVFLIRTQRRARQARLYCYNLQSIVEFNLFNCQLTSRGILKCFHVLPIHLFLSMAPRILFKDKERKWEEIELKLQTEHDSLVLKSSNKVMNLPHIPAFLTDQVVIVAEPV